MKKYLAALALMLTFSAMNMNAGTRHRNHQQTTVTVDNKATQNNKTASVGVEAYSDTTSAGDSVVEDSVYKTGSHQQVNYDVDDSSPFDYWTNTIGWGVGGITLAIVIIVFVLLFLLAPFIIVVLVLRYLVRRHNDRVMLAEKAMENGQKIPESMKPVDKQSEDYLWKRGVKNAAIGAGLMVMFWFWDADALAGIGALVLCYGLGQMFLGHRTKKKTDQIDF